MEEVIKSETSVRSDNRAGSGRKNIPCVFRACAVAIGTTPPPTCKCQTVTTLDGRTRDGTTMSVSVLPRQLPGLIARWE
jgi:hypothetical protein